MTWKGWTDRVKQETGRKGRALFMPLRIALTGRDAGSRTRRSIASSGAGRNVGPTTLTSRSAFGRRRRGSRSAASPGGSSTGSSGGVSPRRLRRGSGSGRLSRIRKEPVARSRRRFPAAPGEGGRRGQAVVIRLSPPATRRSRAGRAAAGGRPLPTRLPIAERVLASRDRACRSAPRSCPPIPGPGSGGK
jgi:hypothetical protein